MSALALRTSDLFGGLDDAQESVVAPEGRVRIATKGTELFRAREPARSIFLVREGAIALSVPLIVCGRVRDLRLRFAHPGETVGWPALLSARVCSVTARVETPAVLLEFDRDALLRVLSQDPGIECVVRRNLANLVARRLAHIQALWLQQMEDELAECSIRGGMR